LILEIKYEYNIKIKKKASSISPAFITDGEEVANRGCRTCQRNIFFRQLRRHRKSTDALTLLPVVERNNSKFVQSRVSGCLCPQSDAET